MADKNKYLLAIDPSLTCSGWALFNLNDNLPQAVGVIKALGPEVNLAQRLLVLQNNITEVFRKLPLKEGDYLICEGPAPLVKNPQSSLKVESVRGIFETVARSFLFIVPGRISPRTVQSEILGLKGPQIARKIVKSMAKETVIKLYQNQLSELFNIQSSKLRESKISQDIVDALLIGTVALSRVKFAIKGSIPVENTFVASQRVGKRSRGSGSYSWTNSEYKKLINE